MSSADFCSQKTFSKNSCMNTIRVSNFLELDQTRQFVQPNLGTNGLQVLSADNKIVVGRDIFKYFVRRAIDSHGKQYNS